MAQIRLGNTPVDVVFKDIKNVHLTVHPPEGRVRIAAPQRMTLDRVRLFAITKLDWIRAQQKALRGQDREPRREFITRESHYLWGRRYLMVVEEADRPPSVEVRPRRIKLTVRPKTTLRARTALMERWYRDQVRDALPNLLERWEPVVGVKAGRVAVRRMKTRWGSCNHNSGSILLNTELAKKPAECLEYVLVHELIHLLEPTHNAHFIALMDDFMPAWRHYRRVLNRLPIRQENWTY
jgi:predicted metal-dependent hydrolase